MNTFVNAKARTGVGSFKWLIVSRVGLLLLAFGVVATLTAYSGLSYFFAQTREQQTQNYRIQLEELLSQKYRDLDNVGNFITRQINALGLSEGSMDRAQSARIVDNLWWFLRQNHDVSEIQLFGMGRNVINAWGNSIENAKRDPVPEEVFRSLANTLQTSTYFDCHPTCVQKLAFPIRIQGGFSGALVISAMLENTVRKLGQLTKSEVAIVNPLDPLFPEPHFVLPKTDMLVSAASNFGFVYEIVRRQPDLLGRENKRSKVIRYQRDNYDFSLQKVSLDNKTLPFQLAVFKSTQADEVLVDRMSQSIFLVSALITFLALLALFLLLNKPLTLLRQVAHALPLLGEKQFVRLRDTIGVPSSGTPENELALIHHTVYQLSERLQYLEDEVETGTCNLIEALESRDREASFVKNLLDSAPVIIVTHNQESGIKEINEFGLKLMQQTTRCFIGQQFQTAFHSHNNTREIDSLYRHLDATQERVAQEFDIVLPDRSCKTIAWAHSQIAASAKQKAFTLSVGIDITERKAAEEHIAYMAKYDELTGLYNRAFFRQVLARILEQCIPGVLCYIDLNHFKLVNDTYGHQAGDAVLLETSQKLKSCFPSGCTVGRLGGDEFAVVQPKGDVDTIVECLKKFNTALEGMTIQNSCTAISVSASAGIVPFLGWSERIDTLMHRADCAMYETKDTPSLSWHVYTGQERMLTYLQESVFWGASIKQALEDSRVEIHYQPIYCLETMKILGHEALARFRNQKQEIESPGAFIHFAEKNGWSVQVDQYIFDAVMQQSKQRMGVARNQCIHINLSAKSFTSNEMMCFISRKLEEFCFPPNRLVFEVTETDNIQDVAQGRKCAAYLRNLGCQIAVDDFGTGYGSLVYLSEFPVDKVKIDISFVREITRNPGHQKLVGAIRDLSKSLNKITVAEGIEDLQTLNLLRDMGIDQAQGYYLGKPSAELKQDEVRDARVVLRSLPPGE